MSFTPLTEHRLSERLRLNYFGMFMFARYFYGSVPCQRRILKCSSGNVLNGFTKISIHHLSLKHLYASKQLSVFLRNH